jgi:hypothetical protein
VLCSLRPETLRSVFWTYDHGYPGCLDPNPDVGGAAPAIIQADLHDGRSLTETVEHERSSPQHPPAARIRDQFRRYRYVTVASLLRHVPTFPEFDGKNRSVLLADFSHSYSRNGTSKTLGHWLA